MKKVLTLGSVALACVLVACGGGGGGGAPMAQSTIKGSVVKGPVNRATVVFKKADGSKLGEVKSDASGNYSFSTDYQGDVTIEATGGNYKDETTGLDTPLSATLTTVVKTAGSEVVGVVTPFTTMAVKYSTQGGKLPTAAQLQQGATTLAKQLGSPSVNLLTTAPAFGAAVNEYGRMLTAFSGYLGTAGHLDLNKLFKENLTATDIANFNAQYAAAYQAANGKGITVALNPNGFTISGTGVGGGSGKCGVAYKYNLMGQSMSMDYCVSGLPASCTMSAAEKAEMDAGVKAAQDAIKQQMPGMNITFAMETSPSCKAGALELSLAK